MKGIASVLAAQGRGPDTTLVHMTPGEVNALQGLASLQGGSLTVNPTTGLPEAGILGQFLPMLAGAAAAYFTGGSSLAAAAAGGGTGLLQHGNLQGAAMGALGGLGGGSLEGALLGSGEGLMPLASEGIAGGASLNPLVSQTALPSFTELGVNAAGTPLSEPLMSEGAKMSMLPQGTTASPFPITADQITAASASPGIDPASMSSASNTLGASKPSFWNSNDIGSNFYDKTGSGMSITGKPGITWLGAGAGLGGAMMLGNHANQVARQNAEERLRRGDPYSPDSMYQQSIANARLPVAGRGWAAGGITGVYPNRIPEREVVNDPTAQVGTEPHVDPFTGQQQGGMAGGGIAGQPRFLKGAGDGMSDSIPAHIEGKHPAALANEEFVVPADVVSGLGNGSSEAGAKQLHAMMDRIRKARTGTVKQGKQIDAQKLMPA